MMKPCSAKICVGVMNRSAAQPQIGRLTAPVIWKAASARPAPIRSKPAAVVRCTVMNAMKQSWMPE